MQNQDEAPLPRIFRLNDLVRQGYGSRSTIWRRVGAGRFPPPVQLGDNSIGWPAREIDGWLNSQPRRTYGAPAPKRGPNGKAKPGGRRSSKPKWGSVGLRSRSGGGVGLRR